MSSVKEGFVYIWRDSKRNLFYIGSHLGSPSDGYTGSNNRLRCAIKSRPTSFRRRILEYYNEITSRELRYREGLWLSLIKENELHGVKYYNEKKVAAGGDIITSLPLEARKKHARLSGEASKRLWKNMSTTERESRKLRLVEINKGIDRSYMAERNRRLCSKAARITSADGTEEFVRNVRDFAKKHNLNYGNLKTMLRGGRQKSCGGFRGEYENLS